MKLKSKQVNPSNANPTKWSNTLKVLNHSVVLVSAETAHDTILTIKLKFCYNDLANCFSFYFLTSVPILKIAVIMILYSVVNKGKRES